MSKFGLSWDIEVYLLCWLYQSYTFLLEAVACYCSADYTYKVNGRLIQNKCIYGNSGEDKYCYLDGNLDAGFCPGAKKSPDGDFYITSNDSICQGKLSLFLVFAK